MNTSLQATIEKQVASNPEFLRAYLLNGGLFNSYQIDTSYNSDVPMVAFGFATAVVTAKATPPQLLGIYPPDVEYMVYFESNPEIRQQFEQVEAQLKMCISHNPMQKDAYGKQYLNFDRQKRWLGYRIGLLFLFGIDVDSVKPFSWI